MIGPCLGWLDAVLSRYVLEPRFVGSNVGARLSWLDELRIRVESLDEEDWFAAPTQLEPCRVEAGHCHGVLTQTIDWQLPELGARQRLGVGPHTQRPVFTLYGDRGRDVWILLHGWLGGSASWDRWAWPFGRLLERFDLLGYALPGHGRRRDPAAVPVPSFPSRHPGRNAVGLALAVSELRQIVQWLRARGYRRVGLAGTSLGAHVAALYATVSADCDRLLLDRPLARLSQPLRALAQRRGAECLEVLAQLEAIYAPVSPIERVLRVPSAHIDVLLGTRDRIAGFDAGRELAARFGANAETFSGGHVVSLGRGVRLWECLARL